MRIWHAVRVVIGVIGCTAAAGACSGSDSPDSTGPGLIETESVRITQRAETLAVGSTVQLNATASPSTRISSVVWSSTAPTVAAVSGVGTVTAFSGGTARIVARLGSSADTSEVVVRNASVELIVTPDIVSIPVGDQIRLAAEYADRSRSASGQTTAWNLRDRRTRAIRVVSGRRARSLRERTLCRQRRGRRR